MGFWKRYPKYVLEINFIFYRNKLIVRSSSSRTYSQTGSCHFIKPTFTALRNKHLPDSSGFLQKHFLNIWHAKLLFSFNCSVHIITKRILQNLNQAIRSLILKLISRPLPLTSKYNNNRQLNLENLDSLKLSNNFLHRFRNPVVALDSWPVWPDTRSFKLTTNF